MALDRDELAARVLSDALYEAFSWLPSPAPPEDRERVAKAISTSLLARLRPEAVAPAPSPAATPAAWVPSVGDVIVVPHSRHPAPEWTKIVVSVGDETVRYESRNSRGEVLRPYGFCAPWKCVFLRRATSSERAAAGLPVDEATRRARVAARGGA